MKKKFFIPLAGAVIVVAAIVVPAQLRPASPRPAASTAPQNEGGAPLHPLMIEAIRERAYPAGPITIEREVGASGGINTQVASYRSDGFKIYAQITTPDAPAPVRGWPVIILCHGYIPPAEYQTLGGDYRYWIEGLTRAGYMVIKPDFRGHGQSEGVAEGGHWSPAYTYDLLNLVASLKQYPGVDPAAIGLVGHSMGGAVVLRAIVVSPDIKASAVLAGVVASAPDLYYNWRRGPNNTPPPGVPSSRQRLVDAHGDPATNPDFWAKISATNYLGAVAGPVQIHHGTADDTVPIAFSASLYAALQAAGKAAEYFVYEGGGHQFDGNSDVALRRMVALFDTNLKSH